MVDFPEVEFAPAQQAHAHYGDSGKIEKDSTDIEAAPAESIHDMDEKSQRSMFEHFEEVRHVKQGLHQRHIQMIALAGTIGTGLFLGSGRAVANAGPLGAWVRCRLFASAVERFADTLLNCTARLLNYRHYCM